LKTVIRAKISPPIAPMPINPMTDSGPRFMNRFHVHAALATTKIKRMPVLFTVPEMVIPWP
jgi:hypothetical protein